MKFGRNQPRSQPIVRVARLKPFPYVYPATRPLQSPLSPNLTVPLSIKSGPCTAVVDPLVIRMWP
jgi:hypothetical protein